MEQRLDPGILGFQDLRILELSIGPRNPRQILDPQILRSSILKSHGRLAVVLPLFSISREPFRMPSIA